MAAHSMDALVSLCKSRGFIFQNAEIYGGLQGMYDYGPLGVELKNNLKAAWWQAMVYERDDVEGLDASILTHRHVLQHSGHEATFADPMTDCRSCKERFRADHVVDNTCPSCGSTDMTEPRPFHLMFKTTVGPIEDSENYAYLRPETAQSIFVNFRNVCTATGRRPPFGIAQIGKAFRNEITPRNFIFRMREFEQMELEYFVAPGEDEQWHELWIKERLGWWYRQGISADRLKLLEQPTAELSHYSKRTVDILYQFPHGLEELEGIANRTDYDLGSHTKNQDKLSLQAKVRPNNLSNARLAYQPPDNQQQWLVPYVIEPSAGLDRGVLAVLSEAYHEEDLNNGKTRTVLKLPNHLAPVKAAIIPLKRNHEALMSVARTIKADLQKLGFGRILLEDSGNIGKCYRRHDEIGTPFCVTIDFQTIEEDNTVTIRQRDSLLQARIPIASLAGYLQEQLKMAG